MNNYEYVERLTLFVLSVELVLLGWLLGHDGSMLVGDFQERLVITGSVAFLNGLCWRFYFNSALFKGRTVKQQKAEKVLAMINYAAYAFLTAVFLVVIAVVIGLRIGG